MSDDMDFALPFDGQALVVNVAIEVRVVDGRIYMYFRNLDPTRAGVTIESVRMQGVGSKYDDGSDEYGRYLRWELSPMDMENTDTFAVTMEGDGSTNTVLRRVD